MDLMLASNKRHLDKRKFPRLELAGQSWPVKNISETVSQ